MKICMVHNLLTTICNCFIALLIKAYCLNTLNYTIINLTLHQVDSTYHVLIYTEFQLFTHASSKPNLDRKGIHDQQEHLLQRI